ISVVGIVGNVRHNGVTVPIKTKFYRPYPQFSQTTGRAMDTGTIVVRTDSDPLRLAEPLRAATRMLDPAIPLAAVRPMTEVVDTALTSPRLTSTVFLGFAAVALALSAVGIYGLLVYLVSQRSHEIGIRVAIGAERRQIVSLVFNHGLRLAGVGIAVGLLLAALLTHTLAGLLYGVPPFDPATFVVVPLVLLGVALVASFVPARRAAAVDPLIALRRP
ncbi:MAG: FtsX-like permease family protein, partial [Vicinamibacterales bacterium]